MTRALGACVAALLSAGGARAQQPAAAAPTAPPALAGARRLSFGQAVELAVKNAPDVQMGGLGMTVSEQRVDAARSQRYARLRTDANVLLWDKELALAFGMPTNPGEPPPKLVVRSQVTSQASITVAQPISALLVLNRLVALEQTGVDVARADRDRARLDAAQRAAEAYIRLLQAKALASIAERSVAQVEAQLERAKVLEKGGMLGQVDVLRLTSARDATRQGLLRARNGAEVAAAGLALAAALPQGTLVDAVDDLPDPPPPLGWNESDVGKLAAQDRPELAAARQRSEQARLGSDVVRSQRYPNVLGIGTVQHSEGQGPFLPKTAYFVGATLSWDIWDWGKVGADVRAAEAQASQAAIGAAALADQIAFEAQRRLIEARTAYETLAVARSALQAAEEAYRIQSVRYAQGAATTTDVLDAETDVSRARSGTAQARYEYYLAQAGLARAVGRQPTSQPGAPHDR